VVKEIGFCMKSISIKIVALLLFIVLSAHLIALEFSLYFKFLWFDIPMHFVGGVFVGALFVYLFSKFYKCEYKNSFYEKVILYAMIMGFSALIGVFWEFYEFIISKTLSVVLQPSVFDTMKDLFFDVFGGLVVSLFFVRTKTHQDIPME
jgi:hypothetical protein